MSLIERTKHDIYPFISSSGALAGCARGQTVLVTGGGRGIGKAIATHFALAGAESVVISGRSIDALEESKTSIQTAAPHCKILTAFIDVTDESSVQRLLNELPFVPSILINNAGVSSSQKSLVESDIDEWWSDYEVNVKGVYLCCRAYLRVLKKSLKKSCVILNVSSAGSFGTSEGMSSLTEYIHFEHFKQGVRCISFHPGGIADTGMGQNALEYFKPFLVDTVNLAAGTALYLCTPRAEYLCGRFVSANWDMEELEKLRDKIMSEDLLKTRISTGGGYLGSVVKQPMGR